MKECLEENLEKLNKYFENPEDIEANVLVKVRGLEQIIEVTALTKRFTLRAEESNENFYAAVDLVVAKLERQIRKNKDRLNKKYKNVEKLEFNFDYDSKEEIEEENESSIVKRKDISMKPMDEEEAMLQIELLNHDFFVFKNIDEECVSVLYKRKDGNYGIINMK
jgi:putative sigma-54 modulation protein